MERIDKNNPNRWALIQNNNTGEQSIVSFGYVGKQGETELESGLPILSSYFTEQELEESVNAVVIMTESCCDVSDIQEQFSLS